MCLSVHVNIINIIILKSLSLSSWQLKKAFEFSPFSFRTLIAFACLYIKLRSSELERELQRPKEFFFLKKEEGTDLCRICMWACWVNRTKEDKNRGR
jgi:hypothetical protein